MVGWVCFEKSWWGFLAVDVYNGPGVVNHHCPLIIPLARPYILVCVCVCVALGGGCPEIPMI